MKISKRWGFGIAVLSLLIGAGQAQAGVYDAWGYRMKIRIADYNQPETLTNFPILVVLNTNSIPGFLYSNFNSPTDGADLRFASSNETTELNYEIEKWDTNGSSYVWVQVPKIASTNDYIYAYWGSVAGVAPCTTNGTTWNASDLAVYHFSETNGTPAARDFTANSRHATISGTTQAQGITGGAQSFPADASKYISGPVTLVGYGISGSFTISMWFKTHLANWQCLVTDGNSYNDTYGYLFIGTSGQIAYCLDAGGVRHYNDNVNAAITLDLWHMIVQRYNGSSVETYYDGILKNSLSASGTVKTGSRNLYFGQRGGSSALDGEMDEVRISSAALSPNWIYTCWLNQASNNTFLAFSGAAPQSTSLAVRANPVSALGPTSAAMNGTVLQTGNAGNPDVYLCWGYTDGGTNATSAWTYVESLGSNWGKGQSFLTNITGLLSGSNYSYRCYVTNSTGYDWSDTAVSFQTLSLPVVTNLGANAIGGQIATLRGQITAIGGEIPSTWFLYWRDGSATTTTVAKGTQSGVFTTALSGLQIGSNYSYRCVASNGAGVAVSADQSFQTAAGEYIWNGGSADNNASTPGNWVQGVVPSETSDSVRLDDTSSKDVTWDITNRVAAWTQTAAYTGTVTILTRYDNAFPCMVIAGDCQILGGKWTHTANGATETYRLRASIGGNLTIGAGTSIDATGKGYGSSQGPGRGNGQNHNWHAAASHGGLGGYPESDPIVNFANPAFYVPYWTTYGSITTPTNLGSGGMVSGGGAISLEVSGATSLQGSLIAKGLDVWGSGAAGGSILLITSTLTGNGVMDASAGASDQCGGGGGRIAIKLTSGTSVGTVSMRAFGGASLKGAAGTIYCETADAGAGRGVLTVFGDATTYRTNTITAIPSATNAAMAELLSLKYVTLVATNFTNVGLLTNLTMGNLFLRNDNAMLRLNGNTLTLKAIYHADWGTTNRVVYDGGEIIWDPGAGTVFSIR